MITRHVRQGGAIALRSRTARALAALALAVTLVPAAPTPARASVISCPSDEFVVEGFVVFDVTDATTIADDPDTRDDFYDYILNDEDWFDGDDSALQSALGSTPEAREAKLTEWLIADFIVELNDEIFRGVGGGRLGTASESPVRVDSSSSFVSGGRQYIRALIWTCSPTLPPELTTAITGLGTFKVVTGFAEPDVTCEATVFSPSAHFGVHEIPGTIPDRFYRKSDGTFEVGATAVLAEGLANGSAIDGAGACTIASAGSPGETMTLTGTPDFGEDLLVAAKVPGTLVGEDFDLWFCPDETLLPDAEADDNGDCVGPFIQNREGDSTTFVLTLALLQEQEEDLDPDAVCGLLFIVHDYPRGGHSNWVGPWECAESAGSPGETMTLTGTPGFGEDLLVAAKVPGTLVGEDFDLWFCPDETLLPDAEADDNGDCVGPFIQTRRGDSTTFVLTLALLQEQEEDLDPDAVCGLLFIVHDYPDGGHSNWVGPWECADAPLPVAIPAGEEEDVADDEVAEEEDAPLPTVIPAGEGGAPLRGGLLAVTFAIGAAALLTLRLGRREATDPRIG